MSWKSMGELSIALLASAALISSATPAQATSDRSQAGGLDTRALARLAAQANETKAAETKPAERQWTDGPASGAAGKSVPLPVRDPRAGDKEYERAKALMRAVDSVLRDAAANRAEAKKLPSRDSFIVPPIWTETREDRDARIKGLLDAALGIVTEVPVVEMQARIEALRKNIRETENQIASLKEKRLSAPKDALLPGILNDTTESIDQKLVELAKRIGENRAQIKATKGEIQAALEKSGLKMKADQVDLLLDSVLSGDLVRLSAAFEAAKLIDNQLGRLVAENGENLEAARKYFAMHAALFAMLVHGQNELVGKIDGTYLPKLTAIENDIKNTAEQTKTLLKNAQNRPDQVKALEANMKSQQTAMRAAEYYRKYLLKQREQIEQARSRAVHDLNIADNTYQTVEASFQLRQLMRDSAMSFEAIQKLETPGFEQIFRNEELRREFENLTKKLGAPTS